MPGMRVNVAHPKLDSITLSVWLSCWVYKTVIMQSSIEVQLHAVDEKQGLPVMCGCH